MFRRSIAFGHDMMMNANRYGWYERKKFESMSAEENDYQIWAFFEVFLGFWRKMLQKDLRADSKFVHAMPGADDSRPMNLQNGH